MTPTATAIWNRACSTDALLPLREGDRALQAMILAHSLIMNGGVIHVAETLARAELEVSCAAYSYFGLGAVAATLRAAAEAASREAIDDAVEDELSAQYNAVVPDDGVLVQCFERHLLAHPDRFSTDGLP